MRQIRLYKKLAKMKVFVRKAKPVIEFPPSETEEDSGAVDTDDEIRKSEFAARRGAASVLYHGESDSEGGGRVGTERFIFAGLDDEEWRTADSEEKDIDEEDEVSEEEKYEVSDF